MVRMDQPDWNALINKGKSLLRLSDYGDALNAFDEVIRGKPDCEEAWHGKGLALAGLRKYEDAVKICDEGLIRWPGSESLRELKKDLLNSMMMPDEKVLCCIRLQNADMILTSERIAVQSLTPKVRVTTHLLPPLTRQLFLGQYGYVAWDDALGLVLGPRGDLSPSGDRKEIFAPMRIVDSMPYSKIRVVRIARKFKGMTPFFAVELHTQEASIPIQLDEMRFVPFWHFISERLADKIIFTDHKEMSRLAYIWVTDLCGFLAKMDFQAEPIMIASADPTKGIIRLSGCNSNFLVMDNHAGLSTLDFVVNDIKGKLQGLKLKTERRDWWRGKKESTLIEWTGKDTRLAEILNQDSTLMELLRDIRTKELASTSQFSQWHVSISTVSEKGAIMIAGHRFETEHFVRIQNYPLLYLPGRDFFHAMDRIAHHVRSAGAV